VIVPVGIAVAKGVWFSQTQAQFAVKRLNDILKKV
jgi:hypothetical protein